MSSRKNPSRAARATPAKLAAAAKAAAAASAAAPRTKKVVMKAKKTGKKGGKAHHPTYVKMIARVLDSHKDFVSAPVIGNLVVAKYSVPDEFARQVRHALKLMQLAHLVQKRKASFRLTAVARRRLLRQGKKVGTRRRKATSAKGKKKAAAGSRKKKTAGVKKTASTKKTKAPKAKAKAKAVAPAAASASAGGATVRGPHAPAALQRAMSGGLKQRAPSKTEATTNEPRCKYSHTWQYWHNSWHNYDPQASDVVEQVFQGYLNNRGETDVRAVRSGQWSYLVDFKSMSQTNIEHEAHTVRSIRRARNLAVAETAVAPAREGDAMPEQH